MPPIRTVAYQATDVARRAREVVDRARESSVLIRDKDGTLLSLGLAADVETSSRLVDLLSGLVRLETLERMPRSQRTIAAFGSFAWAVSLSDDDFHTFVTELEEAALRAVGDNDLDRIEDLLYDWKATAAIAADPELAAELSTDLTEPIDTPL